MSKEHCEVSDPDATDRSDKLILALKQHFSFEHFQPGQRAVISSVLSRKPTLAVMPTGAGKSLCYQLPALISDGLSLVISPLISLMKDQVDGLQSKGVKAFCINSSLSNLELHEVLSAIEEERCDLLYVAPERFRNQKFISLLRQKSISLIAIDEAHCISQWGHDFRPEYAKLGEHLAELDYEMLIACTATATPLVQRDILNVLRLQHHEVDIHVAGFLRQNLYLEARLCRAKSSRQEIVKGCLKKIQGAIIIYANTQKLVEEYAEFCGGIIGSEEVCAYHGGMSERLRTQAQERFMSGEARVVVATNAFGMGVDRGDVRAVIHVEIPRTVEAYYQEVGRAGRDGALAQCLLLYGSGDRRTHEFLINQSHPNPQAFHHVWNALMEGAKSPDELQRILKQASLSDKIDIITRYLIKERLVEYLPHEELIELTPQGVQTANLTEVLNLDAIAAHREHQLQMHDEMYRLAQSGDCRHAYLLSYFGEDKLEKCPPKAHCDRCSESPFQLSDDGLATGSLSDIERNITLKALSGISRAKGYYGTHKVVAMLSGVARSGAEDTFLAQLSTWGVLSSLGFEACLDLVNHLMSQGLCEMSYKLRANGEPGRHKTLLITPLGMSICLGKREIPFRLKQAWIDVERRSTRLPASLPKVHVQATKKQKNTSQVPTPANPSASTVSPAVKDPQTVKDMSSTWEGKASGGWRALIKEKENRSPCKANTQDASKTWAELMNNRSQANQKANQKSAWRAMEPPQEHSAQHRTLSTALKQYRLKRSRELQVPAYTIFSDATLELIVQAEPRSREALLAIKGIGPRTWAQFGLEILEIIQSHAQ